MSQVTDAPHTGPSDGGSQLRAAGVAVGLGLLGPVLAILFGGGIFVVDRLAGGLPLAVSLALTLIFGQYVAFAGLALVYLNYRGLDGEGIRSYLGVRWPTLGELGLVVGGWLVIFVLILVSSIVVQALGAPSAQNQTGELAMNNPDIILPLIAAMFLVVGPCEEILYRGVVQGRLRERFSAVPAILGASVVFAAIHVMALTGGAGARLTTITLLSIPALVLGTIYEYTENIVVVALLHGLHNSVLLGLLYVVVRFAGELPQQATAVVGALPL